MTDDEGFSDDDLARRGIATLLACWQGYARSAPGAVVERMDGVTAAVFPDEPERSIYNNAVLDRRLPPAERVRAVEAMHARYAAAGIEQYAAWAHEDDTGLVAELERRGYTLAETTRAMAMSLDSLEPHGHLGVPMDWPAFLRLFDLPDALLMGGDACPLYILGAHVDGVPVAAAGAFDHDTDCGIYNVATLEHARRRGLAAALTAQHLSDARARGCRTASLQATPMAEGVYASIGFRDLGRILEFAPPARRAPRAVV